MLRAEEMLRADLGGSITIKEMAAARSLSESHFARGFRTSFGTSVHQYLVRLRIERAKILPGESKKQLAEIAQLCGFCDQAAFTRSFAKVKGMTPSRWRRCNLTAGPVQRRAPRPEVNFEMKSLPARRP
jgi:AraC-like DNA-binding protein